MTTLSLELQQQLASVRHVALDMDGTIYLGSRLFPWTKDFLALLDRLGIGYSFLTNNPTRSVDDYVRKLSEMGIQTAEDNIYTTSLAAIDYIKATYPAAGKLFMLGTPSMVSQFEKAGFRSCADDPDDVPDVLVVAFDPTLTYERLCRAAWWASQGIPYVATNPDRVCPTDRPTVLVDCGSLQKCIEHATGRQPDIVLGKPDPTMLLGICRHHGIRPAEMIMAGDRIYTDIAMARNAGAIGVLVLSGETTLETALGTTDPPDLILPDLSALGAIRTSSRSSAKNDAPGLIDPQ